MMMKMCLSLSSARSAESYLILIRCSIGVCLCSKRCDNDCGCAEMHLLWHASCYLLQIVLDPPHMYCVPITCRGCILLLGDHQQKVSIKVSIHTAHDSSILKGKWFLPQITRARFHRAAKHKILLAWNFFLLIKTGLPTKFPFVAHCLLLVLSCCLLILKITWKFVWQSCFNQGRNVMLSNCLCVAALWNWAQHLSMDVSDAVSNTHYINSIQTLHS